MKYFFVVFFFMTSFFSEAQNVPVPISPAPQTLMMAGGQRLRVFVNCVFRYSATTITCDDFKSHFFQTHNIDVARVDSPAQSDLEVTLTDETVDATHVGYTYKWISHLAETSSEPLVVPLLLSTGFDQLSTLTKLVQNATKGLYFYYSVASDSVGPDASTVVYQLPNETVVRSPNWLESLANSPFYFNASLSGNVYGTGETGYHSEQRQFPETMELAYFGDKFKVDLTGSYISTFYSTPNGTGGTISATDSYYYGTALEVYSFSKHWSVAVIEQDSDNPGSNIRGSASAASGIEWALVPFRTTENHELALRIGPTYNHLNLLAPNSFGHYDEKYLGAFTQVYAYWVLFGDKLQASTNLNYSENFKYHGYTSASVSGSLTYNFNSIFSVSGMANYADTPHSLSFPGAPNYSNALQSLFLSGAPGKTLMYTFSFNVRLGNSVKKNRDRRWATSSN